MKTTTGAILILASAVFMGTAEIARAIGPSGGPSLIELMGVLGFVTGFTGVYYLRTGRYDDQKRLPQN